MNAQEFAYDTKTARVIREKVLLESKILQSLARTETLIANDAVVQKQCEDRIAATQVEQAKLVAARYTPVTKRVAQLRLDDLREDRRKARAAIRKIQQFHRQAQDQLKEMCRHYQNLMQIIKDRQEYLKKFQSEKNNDDGGGLGILGTLGMGVFAWRASNAMDNIAKIASKP